jgi:hypothetical protein
VPFAVYVTAITPLHAVAVPLMEILPWLVVEPSTGEAIAMAREVFLNASAVAVASTGELDVFVPPPQAVRNTAAISSETIRALRLILRFIFIFNPHWGRRGHGPSRHRVDYQDESRIGRYRFPQKTNPGVPTSGLPDRCLGAGNQGLAERNVGVLLAALSDRLFAGLGSCNGSGLGHSTPPCLGGFGTFAPRRHRTDSA